MAGTLCFNQIIDQYYPAGSPLRDIYMRHALSVTREALEISHRLQLPLDDEQVRAAAMLHDIGIFLTDAPGIHCHGSAPYIDHGPLGAKLLRSLGAPEEWARVAERHTGAGIGTMVPQTLLERLVCYADKFWSKSGTMARKDMAAVEHSMARFGPESLSRWHALRAEFDPGFRPENA